MPRSSYGELPVIQEQDATRLTPRQASSHAIGVGVQFTNELIDRHRLSARAVVAQSPTGVAALVKEHIGGPVDFCLIDAMHDNQSLVADFGAVRAVVAPDACILLHDVINRHIRGRQHIQAQYKRMNKLLTRAPSGMALVYSSLSAEFEAYLDCFSDSHER